MGTDDAATVFKGEFPALPVFRTDVELVPDVCPRAACLE